MTSIRDIFTLLNDSQKRTLQYAHEHGISQHVEYTKGRFIGVNAQHIGFLEVEQTAGLWSAGRIKRDEVLHEES